jgi:hypothetical protein
LVRTDEETHFSQKQQASDTNFGIPVFSGRAFLDKTKQISGKPVLKCG